ncbi:hypothetical protein MUK42_07981 [Musa troglodytarum]|uniref:Uncharacterized protein n=1 Tax=Musa troglodytarum TaxID=320322 RepID=A0A9E7E905_9LILI|nr:hypothetical protein MUK42_07981 [Musa troglodytarum]
MRVLLNVTKNSSLEAERTHLVLVHRPPGVLPPTEGKAALSPYDLGQPADLEDGGICNGVGLWYEVGADGRYKIWCCIDNPLALHSAACLPRLQGQVLHGALFSRGLELMEPKIGPCMPSRSDLSTAPSDFFSILTTPSLWLRDHSTYPGFATIVEGKTTLSSHHHLAPIGDGLDVLAFSLESKNRCRPFDPCASHRSLLSIVVERIQRLDAVDVDEGYNVAREGCGDNLVDEISDHEFLCHGK